MLRCCIWVLCLFFFKLVMALCFSKCLEVNTSYWLPSGASLKPGLKDLQVHSNRGVLCLLKAGLWTPLPLLKKSFLRMSPQKCLTPSRSCSQWWPLQLVPGPPPFTGQEKGGTGEKLSWKGNNILGDHRVSLKGLDLKIVLQLQGDIK